MCGERGREHGKVVRDRRPADLARLCVARGLEDSAAVHENELEEAPECLSPLQAKELLDVPGPVGVGPLLILVLGQRRREVELRKAAAQEAVPRTTLRPRCDVAANRAISLAFGSTKHNQAGATAALPPPSPSR